ncbi:MAG: SurA N-terminal domain-containing protein [Bacteriovoracaceae bacterium]|nr:SurA N-terminal domain-containing protein [Bacteriovoracaceae bacterium]
MVFSQKVYSHVAKAVVTVIVGVIMFGFIFSFKDDNSNFFTKSNSEVASVDGTKITVKEYQNVLAQQAQRFSQMLGGKQLTPQELEQFGIHRTVLQSLIERKLLTNLAEKLNLDPSTEELKEQITKLSYFQTAGQFDVNLYKAALQSNGFTPSQFEDLIINDIRAEKIEFLLNSLAVSKAQAKDFLVVKGNSVEVQAVKVDKNKLVNKINVSAKEISDFIADKKNEGILKLTYDGQKDVYNQPEQVRAYHILYKEGLENLKKLQAKLTPKNFKEMANKETQDPSGKSNGGDLGWFSRGKMVPEFDDVVFKQAVGTISEPVKTQFGYHLIYVEEKKPAVVKTFDQVKGTIAEENIRRRKTQELDELMKQITSKAADALKAGNNGEIANLEKQYEVSFIKKANINPIDGRLENTTLKGDELQKLFNNSQSFFQFDDAATSTIIKVLERKKGGNVDEKELTAQINNEKSQLARLGRAELMKKLADKASISCTSEFQGVTYCD